MYDPQPTPPPQPPTPWTLEDEWQRIEDAYGVSRPAPEDPNLGWSGL